MNTENDLRIDYIEFPCTDTARVKQFYGAVLGWKFEDYGPGYTSFHFADPEGNVLAVWSE